MNIWNLISRYLAPVLTDSQILYEDKYLLAVNKPHGLVTEFDPRFEQTLEAEALHYIKSKEKYPHKCYIGAPHRLDRPVSGVVLFAKKRSILKILGEMFAERAVKKEYYALVENQPLQPAGELVHYLEKDQLNRRAILHTTERAGAAQAVLSYSTLLTGYLGGTVRAGYSLLHILPATGKFHQIRAQLASIGCPIIGDVLYGATLPYKENAIALHAGKLSLVHPVSQQVVEIAAPFPEDMLWEFPLEILNLQRGTREIQKMVEEDRPQDEVFKAILAMQVPPHQLPRLISMGYNVKMAEAYQVIFNSEAFAHLKEYYENLAQASDAFLDIFLNADPENAK